MMFKNLRSLYRRDSSVRELRQLDRTMQSDIGLRPASDSAVAEADAILLLHRGPFLR